MRSHTRHILTTTIVLAVLAVGAGIFIVSGMYNIGADEPHWMPTRMVVDNLRERSIATRMADVQVPNLDDPKRIQAGVINYSAMCTGCHLAPGVTDSEIRPGLYPTPPDLSKVGSRDDKRTFWIIKHGIKMSAMPAWGKTHTDEQMWNMTAFIRKMPNMTAAQYQALGGKPPEEDEDHMHMHAGNDEHAAIDKSDMGMPEAGAPEHDHDHDHAAGHSHGGDEPNPANAVSMQGLKANAEPGAEAAGKAFHAALQGGNRKAVLALLAPEVEISEGVETQSRVQYAAGHLGEDIAFLKSANIKPLTLASMPMGDTAMVGSQSEIRASHDGQPVAILSTEMLTLKKGPSGWLVTRIRWDSRPLAK